MVLQLYGHPISTCTKRVAIVLLEKNLPFKLHVIDPTKGENKTPDYLEKNPFAQIPTLIDDGVVVYESRAIARYLATKFADQGTSLVPSDPRDYKALASFEQAMANEAENFDKLANPALVENHLKKFYGLPPTPGVFEDLIKKLDVKLDAYDRILSKQRYLAGDEVSLADLLHLPHASLLSVAGSDIMEQKPNVARWFAEISERESWKRAKDGGWGSLSL